MNSKELREYVKKLNQQQQAQSELRRQAALAKIRELRQLIKYRNEQSNIPQ